MHKTAVIIVTHNSQAVLPRCMDALAGQTIRPDTVVLVDSGSSDTSYLESYRERNDMNIIVQPEENIGFSRANNIGYQAVCPDYQDADFILFLNPDAFPEPDSIEQALAFFTDSRNTDIGCISGRLLGFDSRTGQPTGLLDSTGVFRKWYGRWYDRGQGEADIGQHMVQEEVPAVCGAFLFCRIIMLDQIALQQSSGPAVFDPDFFLYKEDIELCLRIRKAGWRITYLPEIRVYHCRGWQKKRQQVPYRLRLTAAESELLLYRRHPSPYILWALAKYLVVCR
ncbi:MAG: glycosyltransferase family 2 protein [Candidatus Electrothrix sp. YB6]